MPEDSGNTLDSSPPAPQPPAILKWSLRILIVASIGLCIDSDMNRLFVLKKPDRIAAPYKLWDGWITSAARGRGLFLKFDQFPPGGAGYAQNIYFRAVYVLFPQPLLVAGPSKKISNGDELLIDNEYPGDQWLRSQGVNSVMTIQMDDVQGLPVVSDVRWLGD